MLKSLKRFGLMLAVALVTMTVFAPLTPLTVPTAQAAATSSPWQNHVFDWYWRSNGNTAAGFTFTPPTAQYVGLYLATGTVNGQGCSGEVTGTGYARILVPSVGTSLGWSGTQGAGTTAASSNNSGTTGSISNNSAIIYGTPASTWGQVGFFCMYDSLTGGNQSIYASLTTPKTVNSGDAAPSFAAGALVITIGFNLQDHWTLQAANDETYKVAA